MSQTNQIPGLDLMLMHSKYAEKKTRITVAGLYNSETTILYLGVAKCFREDTFCRKTGRELAIGRLDLLTGKATMLLRVPPEADVKELFKKNFNEIESFLQQNGLKKLILPLSQGGLNSFEKESSNYFTLSLPAKIKKAVEAEIM